MEIANSTQKVSERLQDAAKTILPAEQKIETPTTEEKVETLVATTEEKGETPSTEIKAEDKKEISTKEAESDLQKFLKENNLSSLDELKQRIAPQEKAKTADEEETEFLAWSAKEGKIKMDDYVDAKKLKDIPDSDLVKQDFINTLRAKNKNISNEEAEKKFDRKFGDEVLDETENPKVVYDEDSITARAKEIREQKFAPINNAKNEFSEVSKRNKFNNQVEQEYKRDIEPKLSEKVVMKHGNAEYVIDLDKEKFGIVKQQVKLAFQNYKQNPAQFGNHFDAEDVVKFWVKATQFDDVAEIIAKQREDARALEELKRFKNPVETAKTRDTTTSGAKTEKQGATEMGEKLRQFAG